MRRQHDREDEDEPVHRRVRVDVRLQLRQDYLSRVLRRQVNAQSCYEEREFVETQSYHQFEAPLDKFLVRIDARVAPDHHY